MPVPHVTQDTIVSTMYDGARPISNKALWAKAFAQEQPELCKFMLENTPLMVEGKTPERAFYLGMLIAYKLVKRQIEANDMIESVVEERNGMA